jgi:hypothetical protein
MLTTSRTSFARLALVAALLPISACSVFKPKPLEPTPAASPPGGPGARPAGAPPAAQPATPPAGQPAATPTGQPAATPTGQAARPAATPPAAATPTARPATPTLTPAQAEAQRAARDSARLAEALTTRRRSRVYLALMYDLHNTSLRSATGGTLGATEDVSLGSLDFAMQRSTGGGLGIAVRTIGGGSDAPEYLEAALLMGSRRFALDLGAAQRTGFDSAGFSGGGAYDSTYTFVRGGFRSRANLGNTDFSVSLRALYYVDVIPVKDGFPDSELEGWSGETGLSWTWNRFPLTVNMGYRLERFHVFGREQELSSFSIGTGLLLGRRPRPPAVEVPAATPARPPATPTTPPAQPARRP